MNASEDRADAAGSPQGPPCPQCGQSLVLLIEPGALEFFCVHDHSVDVGKLLSSQAAAAREALRAALRFWELRQAELSELSEEGNAILHPREAAICERRLITVRERVNTLRRTLAKKG